MAHKGITRIQDLERWFFEADQSEKTYSYWNLYRGYKRQNGNLIATNTDHDDKHDSWQILKDNIQRQGPGTYFVLITEKPKGTMGLHTNYTIEDHTRMNGIHGQQAPMDSLASIGGIGEYTKLVTENAILKKEVDDLRAALDEKDSGSGINRIINRIADNPNLDGIMETLLTGLIMKGTGLSGQKQQQSPGQINGTSNESDTSLTDRQALDNRLQLIFQRFASVFGDTWLDNLENLSEWVINNPDTAKNMLQNL